MTTVRVERTSKVLKGLIVLSVLTMVGAAGLGYKTWGTPQAMHAAWLFGAGLISYGGVRLACWWQYG